MNFLSESSVLKHKEFLRDLKLRYSVIEKSYPDLMGCSLKEIPGKKVPYEIKKEALMKKSEIMLHDLYFNSFADKFYPSPEVREQFGSEANFLYEIESLIFENNSCGFLLIYVNAKNKIKFAFECECSEILLKNTPLLSVDLWEHAYFCDFAFDRKRYLKTALSKLDFSKINDFYKIY